MKLHQLEYSAYSIRNIDTLKMVFGADNAYKRIDAQVEATLQQAADILKEMKIQKDDEMTTSSSVVSKSTELSCTSYETRKTISVNSIRSNKVPKATIRTPSDSAKTRKFYFPPAEMNKPRTPSVVSGSYSSDNYYDGSTTTENLASTPDLFPNAIYIPCEKANQYKAMQKDKIVQESSAQTTAQSSKSTQSLYRKHVQKLAIEPLDDIRYLKCRGNKKPKPDSLFPSATYSAGNQPKMEMSPVSSVIESSVVATADGTTTTTGECSLLFKPMEFVSTSCPPVRMLLQPLEKKQKSMKTVSKTLVKKAETEEFPIVPKQLQSSTKLKTLDHQKMDRTKFSAQFNFGCQTFDLSGILNGPLTKKPNVSTLVINGNSYSV
ncbi:unnamed protein product [Caenorhabditis nigoni]